MNAMKAALTTLLLVMLAGCHVPLRSYRLVPFHPAIEVPELAAAPAQIAAVAKPAVKDCVNPSAPICLAFIELDDMGELFDKAELDTALSLIRRANNIPGSDPIVITFIHGWKNNASEENGNVAGFTAALQSIYGRYKQMHQEHHVIGIYIGWRGDLIKSYFPVARQLSYFNREATAIRIAGATLSSALTQIAARTHDNKKALAIFVGHSFGGLLLERALSEATASQIAAATIASDEAAEPSANTGATSEKLLAARLAVDSRADLIIFINPAGAASEAKPMLDFLTYNRYKYHPFADSQSSATEEAGTDRPLFVSLTSTADLATKVALPIGHAFPYLGFKSNGSFRDLSQDPKNKYDLACFDPHNSAHSFWELKTKEEGAQPQSAYYLSSAPHMQVLQSHVMLKAVGANQMRVSSTGQTIHIDDPNAIADCDRTLFNKQNLNIVSTFRLADTNTCFAVQVRPDRCNGTPYWLMEIDPDVVPDHSTIFTQRFISFIIDTFFAPEGKLLQRQSPQLTH